MRSTRRVSKAEAFVMFAFESPAFGKTTLLIVECCERCVKHTDAFHRSVIASRLDNITYMEGFERKNHDSARKVGKAALQCKADCDCGRADYCCNRGEEGFPKCLSQAQLSAHTAKSPQASAQRRAHQARFFERRGFFHSVSKQLLQF